MLKITGGENALTKDTLWIPSIGAKKVHNR
jgi:hypothetical protein